MDPDLYHVLQLEHHRVTVHGITLWIAADSECCGPGPSEESVTESVTVAVIVPRP